MGWKRSSSLGSVLPIMIFIMFSVDLFLRFLEIDAFTFRPWEAMARYPTPGAPFAPNKRYENTRSYGCLAVMGNRPDLRDYRTQVFTTDAHGYRNTPALERASAILVGSSFSAGDGMSDDETLSARLSELSGRPVYNAAGLPPDPGRIRAIANRLGMREGLVIVESLERLEPPQIPLDEPKSRPASARRRLRDSLRSLPCGDRLVEQASFVRKLFGDSGYSPLKILAQRAYKTLQNNWLLPNIYEQQVFERRLLDGRPMLFWHEEIDTAAPPEKAGRASAYYRWLSDEVKRDHLTVMVVLVPNSFTVFQPLLRDSGADVQDPMQYQTQVEASLRTMGIPVLNLAPIFRERARHSLSGGPLLYWRDDLHWNPEGVRVAAEEIWRAWRVTSDPLPRARRPIPIE
jgi:hypothetical protein